MRWVWPMLFAILMAVSAWLSAGPSGAAQTDRFLLVSAQDVSFLAAAGEDATGTVVVRLASTDAPINWTATISPTVGWLRLGVTSGVAPAGQAEPAEMQIYMQSLGLPKGEYSANVIIATAEPVVNAPVIIPVTLFVAEAIRSIHMPLILKGATR